MWPTGRHGMPRSNRILDCLLFAKIVSRRDGSGIWYSRVEAFNLTMSEVILWRTIHVSIFAVSFPELSN
jgi:hypothetical protein